MHAHAQGWIAPDMANETTRCCTASTSEKLLLRGGSTSNGSRSSSRSSGRRRSISAAEGRDDVTASLLEVLALPEDVLRACRAASAHAAFNDAGTAAAMRATLVLARDEYEKEMRMLRRAVETVRGRRLQLDICSAACAADSIGVALVPGGSAAAAHFMSGTMPEYVAKPAMVLEQVVRGSNLAEIDARNVRGPGAELLGEDFAARHCAPGFVPPPITDLASARRYDVRHVVSRGARCESDDLFAHDFEVAHEETGCERRGTSRAEDAAAASGSGHGGRARGQSAAADAGHSTAPYLLPLCIVRRVAPSRASAALERQERHNHDADGGESDDSCDEEDDDFIHLDPLDLSEPGQQWSAAHEAHSDAHMDGVDAVHERSLRDQEQRRVIFASRHLPRFMQEWLVRQTVPCASASRDAIEASDGWRRSAAQASSVFSSLLTSAPVGGDDDAEP